MSKRNEHAEVPFSGLVLHGHWSPVADTVSGTINRTLTKGLHLIERWREARLHQQTLAAVSKLDAHAKADIGWPWRYEMERSRRMGRR